jgi:hypothetical protein
MIIPTAQRYQDNVRATLLYHITLHCSLTSSENALTSIQEVPRSNSGQVVAILTEVIHNFFWVLEKNAEIVPKIGHQPGLIHFISPHSELNDFNDWQSVNK